MPNWCNNTLSISGNKKDIFNLFRDAGFKGRNTKQLSDFLEKKVINLTSWFPTPKTYLKWDTTNSKRPKKQMNQTNNMNYIVKDMTMLRNIKKENMVLLVGMIIIMLI